jgi:hypothetical protein
MELVRSGCELGAIGDPACQRSSGGSARVACRPLLRFVQRGSAEVDGCLQRVHDAPHADQAHDRSKEVGTISSEVVERDPQSSDPTMNMQP